MAPLEIVLAVVLRSMRLLESRTHDAHRRLERDDFEERDEYVMVERLDWELWLELLPRATADGKAAIRNRATTMIWEIWGVSDGNSSRLQHGRQCPAGRRTEADASAFAI